MFGAFSDALIANLANEILRLRASSTEPITLLINSNGGATRSLDILEGLIRTPDADGRYCRVVTVTIGNAGSAAATLLAMGDYAIAYPSAKIHFHGVRLSDAKDVTMERASDLATWLKDTNNSTAIRLARSFMARLVFHYSVLKEEFDEIEKTSGKTDISEVECFARCLQKRLSPAGDRIIEKSLLRWRSIQRLSAHVFTRLKDEDPANNAKFEAAILREIVDFEVGQNAGKDWSLDAVGISQVVEDYTILRDYHTGEHNQLLEPLVETFAPAFMTRTESEDYFRTDEKKKKVVREKLAVRVQPFWYFTVSLCRYLQEEENPLTTYDAYWLGAINEILGSGLPCFRELAENDPEQLEFGVSDDPKNQETPPDP